MCTEDIIYQYCFSRERILPDFGLADIWNCFERPSQNGDSGAIYIFSISLHSKLLVQSQLLFGIKCWKLSNYNPQGNWNLYQCEIFTCFTFSGFASHLKVSLATRAILCILFKRAVVWRFSLMFHLTSPESKDWPSCQLGSCSE